jgi:hypothetical protein
MVLVIQFLFSLAENVRAFERITRLIKCSKYPTISGTG